MRRQLELHPDDWHKLATACDTRSEYIRVPRAVIDKLMRDHSHLIALHKGEVTE